METQNTKKDLKRFNHLIYKLSGLPKLPTKETCADILNTTSSKYHPKKDITRLENIIELHLLAEKLEIKDLNHRLITLYKLKRGNEILYSSMPDAETRDNKDIKVGSGNSWRNTIRVPKKIRKNAWKKFNKLFPVFLVKK